MPGSYPSTLQRRARRKTTEVQLLAAKLPPPPGGLVDALQHRWETQKPSRTTDADDPPIAA